MASLEPLRGRAYRRNRTHAVPAEECRHRLMQRRRPLARVLEDGRAYVLAVVLQSVLVALRGRPRLAKAGDVVRAEHVDAEVLCSSQVRHQRLKGQAARAEAVREVHDAPRDVQRAAGRRNALSYVGERVHERRAHGHARAAEQRALQSVEAGSERGLTLGALVRFACSTLCTGRLLGFAGGRSSAQHFGGAWRQAHDHRRWPHESDDGDQSRRGHENICYCGERTPIIKWFHPPPHLLYRQRARAVKGIDSNE